MEFKKILPSPALQPYVRCYWIFDVRQEDTPFSQLLFPFGSFELIFNLFNAPHMKMEQRSMFRQPGSLYPGQFTRPFILSYTQPARCLGVSLHPWAGRLLFSIPAQEFTDQVNEMEDKSGLRERLLHCGSEAGLVAILESYLLEKLKNYEPDEVSSYIARYIIRNPCVPEIRNVVASLGYTRRRIEQRFLEATGLPMGRFIRKVRFQKTVHLLRNENSLSLTQAGLEAGYYDQAHFIREFREFAGVSPSSFLKQTSEMQNFVAGLMIS